MNPKIITLLFLMTFSCLTYGQKYNESEIYEIISAVIKNVNPEIPIVDTLSTTSFKSKFLRKQIENKISFNRQQKRILKKGDKKDSGILINRTELSHFKFYDYHLITDALKNNQSEFIREKSPFYFISKPIIFSEINIAIVDMDLMGGFGVIYILKRIDGKWTIINEVGKWYA